jgi:hypothetical protein
MLEQYAPLIRDIVGKRHGVYALYSREKLYYVGLATNLKGRLGSHLRDRHKGLWDRFSVYLTIDHGHIKELESLVIRIAQPKGNRQQGKFAKSENLAKSLRRLYREHLEQQWAEFTGKKLAREAEAGGKRRGRKANEAKGKGSGLAGRFDRAISLRGVHKRKPFKGRLRIDGTIRTAGKTYDSPSSAAAAVVGHAVNGWWFWHYERAPGQWVRLKELRRRR